MSCYFQYLLFHVISILFYPVLSYILSCHIQSYPLPSCSSSFFRLLLDVCLLHHACLSCIETILTRVYYQLGNNLSENPFKSEKRLHFYTTSRLISLICFLDPFFTMSTWELNLLWSQLIFQ